MKNFIFALALFGSLFLLVNDSFGQGPRPPLWGIDIENAYSFECGVIPTHPPICDPGVTGCVYACQDGNWIVVDEILCPDAIDHVCPNYSGSSTGKTGGTYTNPINLLDNAPNPFDDRTLIRYQLNAETKVSLTVYNSLGQEVAQLLQENPQGTGIHEISFEGAGLAAGIYHYRLSAVGKVLNGKMMKIQ